MNAKEILTQIKSQVSSFFAKEEVFVDIKGENDVLYRLPESGLAVDAEIKIINEDGTFTPVENGTYILDGQEVIVEDSKVKEIKPVEETEEVVEEEMVEAPIEEMPSETTEAPETPSMEEVIAVVQKLIDVVTALDARISAIENVEEYNKKFSAIEERLQKIEDKPLAQSIKKESVEIQNEDPYVLRLRKLKK